MVLINEVITAVSVGLELAPSESCPAGDANADGRVAINEVIAAVNNGLVGCPATPTPTPSPTTVLTATHTHTRTATATYTQTAVPSNTPTSTRTPSRTPTRTRTPNPTRTPKPTNTRKPTATPTRTPTPQEIQSVCGGRVTSKPKVCNVVKHDAGVVGNVQYVTFGYCLSDLEGDLSVGCAGFAAAGAVLYLDCTLLPSVGGTVNECLESDPIAIGPRGFVTLWTFGISVGDHAGNISEAAETSFLCCQ
jgi:hypothetical protein